MSDAFYLWLFGLHEVTSRRRDEDGSTSSEQLVTAATHLCYPLQSLSTSISSFQGPVSVFHKLTVSNTCCCILSNVHWWQPLGQNLTEGRRREAIFPYFLHLPKAGMQLLDGSCCIS